MSHTILASITLMMALAFTGCAKKEARLTEAQKAMIRQEVIRAMKPMWVACEKMDPAIMTKYCMDSPEFAFATADGKVYSYAEFCKSRPETAAQFPSQKISIPARKSSC